MKFASFLEGSRHRIGVVNVDEAPGSMVTDEVLAEIRAIPAIQWAWRIRL